LAALSRLSLPIALPLYLTSPACFSRSTWIAANRPSVVMQSRPGSAPQKGQRILVGLTVRVRERLMMFLVAHGTCSSTGDTTGFLVSAPARPSPSPLIKAVSAALTHSVTTGSRSASVCSSHKHVPRIRPLRLLRNLTELWLSKIPAQPVRFRRCEMLEHSQSLQPIAISSSPARRPSGRTSIGKTPRGSHEEKLFQLVLFVEDILFLRWQSLDNDPGHNAERLSMEAITDNLLAIKIHKLGWPDPFR